MTGQSFTTAAGHRAGVPKIAVVVTDGKSNNPSATAAAAQKARASGKTATYLPFPLSERKKKMEDTETFWVMISSQKGHYRCVTFILV